MKNTERTAFPLLEFCQRVRISRGTAYSLAQRGLLSIRKLGGKAVVLADEERRFLASLPAFVRQPGWRRRKNPPQ